MNELIDMLHRIWHSDVCVYQGYFALFFAAMIYLYCLKKKPRHIACYLYFSMGFIVLFCFPPFAWLFSNYVTGEGTYFRLLWVLPTMPLIAYTFVHWMSCLKKRSQKLLWLIAAFWFVWLSGTFVYWRADWSQNGYSTRNPNLQEQMELCLVLDALEDEKTVIADDDFLPLLRQVSGSIHLLYGADISENGAYSEEIEKLHDTLSESMFDSQTLLNTASELGANYLILSPDSHVPMPRLDELVGNGEIEIVYETERYVLIKF